MLPFLFPLNRHLGHGMHDTLLILSNSSFGKLVVRRRIPWNETSPLMWNV